MTNDKTNSVACSAACGFQEGLNTPQTHHSCQTNVTPRTLCGVPNALQFCGIQECRAECGAQFCDIRLPQQLTPAQPIDDRHAAKKQGAELCGCQYGVVLNGIPPFTEQFHPSCHCAIWQSIITTRFSQSLITVLCTTTSCNFNFYPGALFFCNHVVRVLELGSCAAR